MLEQETMISRVRLLCRFDERPMAAMTYGPSAQGEGGGLSDIEFVLSFDDALESVDQTEWVIRTAPVELYYVNEFGNGTAIFGNLVARPDARPWRTP